jgi:hypothetical protein
MDYILLFKGITVQQMFDIAENWYVRLNRLKQYRIKNPNSMKALLLTEEMTKRMSVIGSLYIEVQKALSIPRPKFKKR